MTVVNRHALVTGVALPGQRVTLALRRGGGIAGVAEAMADVNSGGFVAMLHDLGGNPVETQTGDVVSVQSGGKSDSMRVVPFTVHARTEGISGEGPLGASIPLALTRVGGSMSGEAVVTIPASGEFAIPAARVAHHTSLAAGQLAVGTLVDSGGDQEAASAFVPGAQIFEGSALVRGWTVGYAPRLTLTRGSKILVSTRIHSAPDGTFQLELHRGGRLVRLAKGDVLRIGSRRHPRIVSLPKLSLTVRSGARTIQYIAPAHVPITLTVTRANGRSIWDSLEANSNGTGTTTVAGGAPLELGDVASLNLLTRTGDEIFARGQARGILLRLGTATVAGTVEPGAVLSIHALSAQGLKLAGAIASADSVTGSFKVELQTRHGRTVRLAAGMLLVVRDGSLVTTTTVPSMVMTRNGTSILSEITTSPRQAVTWRGLTVAGESIVRRLHVSPRGILLDRYGRSKSSPLRRVELSLSMDQGVTVEATLPLTKRAETTSSTLPKPSSRACVSVRRGEIKTRSGGAAQCAHLPPVGR